jgi:hypothetical protein
MTDVLAPRNLRPFPYEKTAAGMGEYAKMPTLPQITSLIVIFIQRKIFTQIPLRNKAINGWGWILESDRFTLFLSLPYPPIADAPLSFCFWTFI